MLKTIAAIVDHSVSRVMLTLFGLSVTLVFGAFAVILVITNAMPGESLWAFLVGLGGCLGVVGWWARLFIRSSTLAKRPFVRIAVIACLAAGVGASAAGAFMFPRGTPGQIILWLMAGVGALLLMGSLSTTGSGPNNSFKPKPLRGSA